MKQALITYRTADGDYSFSFPAESWDDAEQKLRAIRATATVTGWPAYRIPANSLTLPFVHVFVSLFTAIKNALR
jgi:hypothetical protein